MLLHALRCRFGKLDGSYTFTHNRLVLVLADNEEGKTTLVEAIATALYGYEPNQRRVGGILERERYLPIDDSPCFVQIDFTAQGRHLLLRRDLEGRATDTVHVTDLDKALDVTAELSPSTGASTPGERLLRLSREQFLKVCFLRHGQAGTVADGASLTELVSQMVDSSVGERTAESAIDALDRAFRQFQGITLKSGLVENEIKGLAEKLLAAQTEELALRLERDAVDADARRLGELDHDDRTREQDQERLLFLANRAEIEQLQSEARAAEERAGRIIRLQKEIQDLDDYRAIPRDAVARIDRALSARDEARAELAAATEKDNAQRRDIDDAQGRLARMGPVAAWSAADRDEVVTWRNRLEVAVATLDAAETAWTDALRNATPTARELFGGSGSPFDDLADDERRALLRYPEQSGAMRHTVENLRRGPEESGPRGASPAAMGLLLAGGLVLLLGIALLFVRLPFGVVLVCAGGVLLGAGRVINRPRRVDERDVEARVIARRNLADAESTLQQIEDAADRLAARVGAAGAAEAAIAMQDYLTAQSQSMDLRTRGRLTEQAHAEFAEAQEQVASLWQRAGETQISKAIAQADGDRLLRLVNDAFALQQQIAKMQTLLSGIETDRARAEERLSACERDWQSWCDTLGLTAADPKTAVGLIAEKDEKRQRLEACETELQVLDQGAGAGGGEDRASRLHDLAARVEAMSKKDPDLLAHPVDRQASDYLDERENVQRLREQDRRQWQELRDRVGRSLDDFRARMPQVLESKESIQRRLDQTRQYKDALVLAMSTLREVAQESRGFWAETLNTHAGSILHHLAPNYAEIKFGEQLEIRVMDGAGRPWSPLSGRLSKGVSDRIYLAARIALADYCSPEGDPLPLILDDPFVNSDDGRFDTAMNFLLSEVTTRHQVFVLSCHRQRHEALMSRDADHWHQTAQVLELGQKDAVVPPRD